MNSASFGEAHAVCDFPKVSGKAKSRGEQLITNRTGKGQPTANKTRNAILYIDRQFDMGRQHDVARGQWYGADGAMTMDDALVYGTEQALAHQHTFHLVVSVRDGDPSDAQFVDAIRAVGEHVQDYQLLVHRDTKQTHAHVLWYRDELTSREEFFAVKNGIETTMKAFERDAIMDGKLSRRGWEVWHQEQEQMRMHGLDYGMGR